jgi:hypothetical protein
MLIDLSQIHVLGPLSRSSAGLADELAYQGYTPNSARFQIWLMAPSE